MFESVDKHERRCHMLRNRQVLLQINNISVPFSVLSVPTRTNRKLEVTQPCGMQQTWMLLITRVFFSLLLSLVRDLFTFCPLEWVTTTSSSCFSCCTNAPFESTKGALVRRRVRHPSRGWQVSLSRGTGARESVRGRFSNPTDIGLDLLTPMASFLRNGSAARYFFFSCAHCHSGPPDGP